MVRDRRAALAAALGIALVVLLEFLPALSLPFMGDDFELLSLARIAGASPRALVLPHRGAFVKPVLNVAWSASARLLGSNAGLWYTLALLVHLLDAALLGLLACRLSAQWAAPEDPAGEPGARASPISPALTGLLTALIWAVHDRLSEPVFSIASLNHSLTFALYLFAMLAAAAAIARSTERSRLLTALGVLLTLFSYEVGASVLLAVALLAWLTPSTKKGFGARLAALGWPSAAAVIVWIAVQGLSRLSPGAVSYYSPEPGVWLRNLAGIGLSFGHVPSYRIEPSALWAFLFTGILLAGALWPRADRVLRFGCVWALAACVPVLPIPFFSDRYHYIVFAGIALALGRGAAMRLAARTGAGDARKPEAASEPGPVSGGGGALGRMAPVAPAGLAIVTPLIAAHLVWSVLGAREQASYYAFKGRIAKRLLAEAEASDARIGDSSAQLAILWRGDPGQLAAAFQQAEMRVLKPRFSETHAYFVRPQGILGVVYPADLFNVAAAGSRRFYRRPSPDRAAGAVMDGTVRLVTLGERAPAPEDAARLAARLRDALVTRREIPVSLDSETPPAALGPWSVACLETTDRTGAFEEEYGPSRSLSAAAPTED